MEGNQSALTSARSLFQLLNYRNGLEELLLMYWWVIVLGNLVLFAFAKHSLMCWELHRDRRRLECCHMRHCQRRRAAHQSKSVTACRSHRTHTEEAANTTSNAPTETSSSSKDQTEARVTAKHAVDYVSKNEKTTWFPLLVPIVPTLNKYVSPPRTAELMAKAALCRNCSEQEEATATVHQNDTRPPSLLLPLPSVTSSDLSSSSPLSTAQASTSATTRLLNRLGFMSPDLKQTNAERFDISRYSSSSNASSRLSNCCPRYSADEQRLIDQKRQENVRAWMEAKRALELTESLAAGSCGVIPLSSVNAREFQPRRKKGEIETELVS
ncbi:hypothetical protein LMJF_35_4290 [Leishmania major strain Friedlin]|uniref:Uncharacterized protein n=1 Tax=Leishmania major TaxID=5664 RepID=E9AFQ6_LEIMA|nr:hypothetical protein LMJF_35_4290 [Leishmania major strain Friedlin]CAG9582787.1 hypothetical_protein_-_conserved [Leishmania major strain Friedlin]CBZ13060.1 hypothetical protein LMJF_35_4290 [Leishmania major strain Friedlin]|eukprot:XP_003722826.1 hypothetical protein LMJF_35_4290 [Leishmania major strain Friedlin]